MKYCPRCGSLAWDGSAACPACGSASLEALSGRDPDLRGALLLVCSGRPGLLSDWRALRSALSDAAPHVLEDTMLAGALEAALPCAADGEGYVRQALSGGRYPYPAELVDEVVLALADALRLATDPGAFAASPGDAWRGRPGRRVPPSSRGPAGGGTPSPGGAPAPSDTPEAMAADLVARAGSAASRGDWDSARRLYSTATTVDDRNAEAWLGLFLADRKCAAPSDLLAKVQAEVDAAKGGDDWRRRTVNAARDSWAAASGAGGMGDEARRIARQLQPDRVVTSWEDALASVRRGVEWRFDQSGEYKRAVQAERRARGPRAAEGLRADALALVDAATREDRYAVAAAGDEADRAWAELRPEADRRLEEARAAKARADEEARAAKARADEEARAAKARAELSRLVGELRRSVAEADGLAGRLPEAVRRGRERVRSLESELKAAATAYGDAVEAAKHPAVERVGDPRYYAYAVVCIALGLLVGCVLYTPNPPILAVLLGPIAYACSALFAFPLNLLLHIVFSIPPLGLLTERMPEPYVAATPLDGFVICISYVVCAAYAFHLGNSSYRLVVSSSDQARLDREVRSARQKVEFTRRELHDARNALRDAESLLGSEAVNADRRASHLSRCDRLERLLSSGETIQALQVSEASDALDDVESQRQALEQVLA